jgi:Kef-type K+ transport system membrane component KefB
MSLLMQFVVTKFKVKNIFSTFIISLGIILILCLSLADGQDLPESFLVKLKTEDNPNWKMTWNKETGTAKRLFGSRSKVFQGKPQDAAKEFLSLYHGLFSLNPDLHNLQIREIIKMPFGERIVFKQYYHEKPIIGTEISVFVSDKNYIFSVRRNRCIHNFKINTKPSIEKEDAVWRAERTLALNASVIEKTTSELVILPKGGKQTLVWKIIISQKDPIDKTWLVYVDAKKGEVLYKKRCQNYAKETIYTESSVATHPLTTQYTLFTNLNLETLSKKANIIPLFVGAIIFLASLISLYAGFSVAIIEILLGAIAGNLGLHAEEWMIYIASLGGIILTFLAGTEIDIPLMKEKFKESFLIGFFSFLAPFTGISLYTYFVSHWSLQASLIAGTALSTTSLAVVYSVLVETGLSKTHIGKLLMASTFITDMGTALALSVLFVKPTLYTVIFIIISIVVIFGATKFSHHVFHNPRLRNKLIEPEIKYIFLLLIIVIYFADLGAGQAVLPAFVLGLFMSKHFTETSGTKKVHNRLRTVAYAFVTPIFFVVGGLKISLPLILSAFGLFMILFVLKIVTKFIGVYFLAKKYIPQGSMYTTLLMSTGLTFGTIATVFGLNAGYINQVQYSVLIGVVIASAVIPTFIAQKWFMPVEEEDLLEIENGIREELKK